MKTLQQLSKITYKVLLVAILNSLLFLLFSFNSFCKYDKDAYEILRILIKKEIQKDKKFTLSKDNSNSYLIEMFKKFEAAKEEKELNTLKEEYGIKNSLEYIFNNREYSNFIKQYVDSNWDFSKINVVVLDKDIKSKINISFPIFTKDKKTAIIFMTTKTRGMSIVFNKVNGNWIEKEAFDFQIR